MLPKLTYFKHRHEACCIKPQTYVDSFFIHCRSEVASKRDLVQSCMQDDVAAFPLMFSLPLAPLTLSSPFLLCLAREHEQ